jgi:spore coat protein CotH
MLMGNKLKDRFLATAAFKKVYEDEYRVLYQKLYASGAATAALNQAVSAAKAAGAKASTVDSEAATLRTLIDNRTKSLAANDVITQR